MFSAIFQAKATIEKLENQVKHEREHYKKLVRHIQTLAADKRALSQALALLGQQLVNAETGLTLVQKANNATLEELRALRRLETALRDWVKSDGGMDEMRLLGLRLDDVEEARKERHQ